MQPPSAASAGAQTMQEFTDKAIDDPAELEALRRRLHRPLRLAWWVWWLIGAGVLIATGLAGFLLGRLL